MVTVLKCKKLLFTFYLALFTQHFNKINTFDLHV